MSQFSTNQNRQLIELPNNQGVLTRLAEVGSYETVNGYQTGWTIVGFYTTDEPRVSYAIQTKDRHDLISEMARQNAQVQLGHDKKCADLEAYIEVLEQKALDAAQKGHST